MNRLPEKTAWLFCTVIDNFGDIGVAWRLARELSQRLGWRVHLWLDDLAALRAIIPDTPNVLPCIHADIALHHWQAGKYADISQASTPDIVIETFACTLPESVRRIIRSHHPVWLNWEYLSAEEWAVRTHAMQSLQADGSSKYFWQMGFVPQSGGLLREADYAEKRQAFIRKRPMPVRQSLSLFVFAYDSPVWPTWFEAWRQSDAFADIRLAGGRVAAPQLSGSLNVHKLSFVPQPQFDALLWAHDILIVRGEDSFVRAQLSGKPFFWHIYPQDEMAHLDKLSAFWQLYWESIDSNVRTAHQALSQELNGAATLDSAQRLQHWQTLLAQLPQWQQAAQNWQAKLFAQSDAVSRLHLWLNQLNPSS